MQQEIVTSLNFPLCNKPWVEMNNDEQCITQALAKMAGADLVIEADSNKLYCICLFVCLADCGSAEITVWAIELN